MDSITTGLWIKQDDDDDDDGNLAAVDLVVFEGKSARRGGLVTKRCSFQQWLMASLLPFNSDALRSAYGSVTSMQSKSIDRTIRSFFLQ